LTDHPETVQTILPSPPSPRNLPLYDEEHALGDPSFSPRIPLAVVNRLFSSFEPQSAHTFLPSSYGNGPVTDIVSFFPFLSGVFRRLDIFSLFF